MNRMPWWVVVVVLMLGGWGCVMHRPHRTYTEIAGGRQKERPERCVEPTPSSPPDACNARPDTQKGFVCTSIARLTDTSVTGKTEQDAVACYAEERHVPLTSDVALEHGGFDLHIVEFDDQGYPWNPERLQTSVERIAARLADGPALVVTFIHGWKHNADVCDANLSCFREVLETIAKGEQRFATLASQRLPGPDLRPRRVIGIYIAWRGGAVNVEPAKELSFWSRKHAAHTVGDNGAVTNFIQRIRSLVRPHPASMALFVGHSFGGAMLLSAMGNTLIGDLGQAAESARQSGGQVEVDEGGNLFVLVNPALEGSRYDNIFNAAMQAPDYSPSQLPVLLTMAAENDAAVGLAFPLGQAVSTWSRSARDRKQWQAMLQGVGLYKPYHTHRLELKEGVEVTADPKPQSPCACPSGLQQISDALVRRLEPIYQQIIDDLTGTPDDTGQNQPAAAIPLAGFREFLYSTLEPAKPVDPHLPFMTIQVDHRVIDNHGGLFNPRFLDFLIEYVVQIERKRGTLARAMAREVGR